MSWRPQNDGDVDRDEFENMAHNRTSVQDVLLFIFKNKKRKYAKKKRVMETESLRKKSIASGKWNVKTEKSEESNTLNKNETIGKIIYESPFLCL